MKNTAVVILAAGKGERMKSELPKVLHPICGRPMLEYVLDLARDLKINNAAVVLGYKHDAVKKYIRPGIKIAIQKRLLGTADAVREALSSLGNFKGTILVLYGDIPLLKKETIEKLLRCHYENKFDATILSADAAKPAGYGRVLRDKYASVCGIVEEKDADDFQKEIKEVNTGIICFQKDKLQEALRRIRPNNRKKEYYLTDAVGIFYEKGYLIGSVKIADAKEAMGINSRAGLARANKIMQKRINQGHMEAGVSIVDADSTFIGYGAKIGVDTVIYPFTVIERDVKIGKRCSVGPFAHIRGGSRITDDVVAGNFLEIVRSTILANTFVKHFGYLGDSRIGRRVNIGAGTVIANFDGLKKNTTVIEDGAFIGSDSVLISPVKVGKGAVTAAGSVVPKGRNVKAGSVVAGVPAKILKK